MKRIKLFFILILIIVFGTNINATAPIVTWLELGKLDNSTGIIPQKIQDLTKKDIQIAGFIVPLELGEDMYSVTEFVLVPNPLACLHVPPPPPNQMIYVKMNKEIPLDMDERGVYITGQLSVPKPKADYGVYSYELLGTNAEPANIEFRDEILDLISE